MPAVDNTTEFGYYQPRKTVGLIINITRSLGVSWLSKRLIYILRMMATILSGHCIDTSLFNAQVRMYTKGNVSEKRALFSPQIFEDEERRFIANRASTGGTGAIFIDIGANIGLYSLSVGDSYKQYKHTHIYAIEPHPDLYKRLDYNVQLNPEIPIHTANIAIMDKTGEFYLQAPDDNLGQGLVAETGRYRVSALTLVDFIAREKIDKISALKIDVEGNEEKVLLPFLTTADSSVLPEIIVIENNASHWHTDLIATLQSKGYHLVKKTRMNYILTLEK